MHLFREALVAKQLWRSLHDLDLLGNLIRSKYLNLILVSNWFRKENICSKGCLNAWKGLISSFHLIKKWLAWCIGDDCNLKLGMDPWVGSGSYYKLSSKLRDFLWKKVYNSLGDYSLVRNVVNGNQVWINLEHLQLLGSLEVEWNGFIYALSYSGIFPSREDDKLSWTWD